MTKKIIIKSDTGSFIETKLKEMRRPKKSSAKNQMSESDYDVDEGIGHTGTLNPYKRNQNATKDLRN